MTLFEIKTDNSIFGIVAETGEKAMKFVFDETNERFIHNVRIIDEIEMKQRYIYDNEMDEDFSLFDLIDFNSSETYMLYTNDSEFID